MAQWLCLAGGRGGQVSSMPFLLMQTAEAMGSTQQGLSECPAPVLEEQPAGLSLPDCLTTLLFLSIIYKGQGSGVHCRSQ